MIRIVTATLLAAALGATGAPLQCGGGSDSGVQHEDTGGDALYALAQDFHAKGNEPAAKDTLRYLVAHYPSNRHAPAARAELGEGPTPSGSAP